MYGLGTEGLILLVFKNEGSIFYSAPEHGNSHGSIIAYKGCIHWKFEVHYFGAFRIIWFHRRGSKCQPVASKQAVRPLKTFLDKQ